MTLKEARKAAGFTQKSLSEWLKIPRRTIEDWERGAHQCPDWCENILINIILNKEEYDNFKSKIDKTDSLC